jgi:transcriptional regulator with XRE-family HTH domain
VPRTAVAQSFGALLRHWRQARRMSQLGLATEAEVSARHVSFLETGKARPSRDMVQLLANVLDVSLGDRNGLLLAAGYAPAYTERTLEAPELDHVRRALAFILRQHEPYPAIVLDGGWDVVMRNGAAHRIFRRFLEPGALSRELALNAMHSACHPAGMRRFIENWEEFAGPLVQTVHREAADGTNAPAARLRDALLAYPGMPQKWKHADPHAPAPPVVTMRLRRGDLSLAFFSTLTTLATPRDVMLEQLRIECFYPADRATEDAARRLADEESGRQPTAAGSPVRSDFDAARVTNANDIPCTARVTATAARNPRVTPARSTSAARTMKKLTPAKRPTSRPRSTWRA